MSAAGIAAAKRCFLLSGTYITEAVPGAAPLRACGLPDAVLLAISATSACGDLHLEGEEGGGKRRFSSTATCSRGHRQRFTASLLRPWHHGGAASSSQRFSKVGLQHTCPQITPTARAGPLTTHLSLLKFVSVRTLSAQREATAWDITQLPTAICKARCRAGGG